MSTAGIGLALRIFNWSQSLLPELLSSEDLSKLKVSASTMNLLLVEYWNTSVFSGTVYVCVSAGAGKVG